jgi:hypothetical protein
MHGGYGYTRDYAVEQFYRDNRLSPIHEGTHGIQALDLLGRKVVMNGGSGLQLLVEAIGSTIAAAANGGQDAAGNADQLEVAGQVVIALGIWLEQLPGRRRRP